MGFWVKGGAGKRGRKRGRRAHLDKAGVACEPALGDSVGGGVAREVPDDDALVPRR